MNKLILAAALTVLAPGAAFAQAAAPAAAPTPAPAGTYSTATTEIGTLLDDPAARAVLDKYLPGMTSNDQVEMARAMTLKDIQQYSPDMVTDQVLTQLDAAFAKLPAKK